ncbi:MAG: restriction endonuclease [Nitrospirales bacterium]
MPRRTNQFQDLIALVERALAPTEAVVTSSELLTDRLTGTSREADIVIRHRVGNHMITISVECTGAKRRASVQWVDRMIGTHQSLPTDKLILVARSGFTKEARAKATALGVSAYALAEAEAVDWADTVRRTTEVKVVSLLMPYLVEATVILDADLDTCPLPKRTSQLTRPVSCILTAPSVAR